MPRSVRFSVSDFTPPRDSLDEYLDDINTARPASPEDGIDEDDIDLDKVEEKYADPLGDDDDTDDDDSTDLL